MRRLFSKRALYLFAALAIGSWILIQVALRSAVDDALARLAPLTVAPPKVGSARVNPFTGRLTLLDVMIPQRKIVNVDDSVLEMVPLLTCERLDVTLDVMDWFTDDLLHITEVKAGGLQLGAVVGPMNDIPRIDLVILPGLLLGAVPQTDGILKKMVTYQLDRITTDGVVLKLVPPPSSNVGELVVQNINIEARDLTNAVRGDTVNEGSIDISLKLPPSGTASASLRIDSFDDLFRKGQGRLIVKADRLPADQCNLMLERLGRSFHYSAGTLSLDLDADFAPSGNESKWSRRRDEFKTIQLRANQIPGVREDAISRGILRQIRLYNGNSSMRHWFAGTLGRTKAGVFQFNLDDLIRTSPF